MPLYSNGARASHNMVLPLCFASEMADEIHMIHMQCSDGAHMSPPPQRRAMLLPLYDIR